MLHGLVCPNRRGLIDFGNDRWEDAQQPGCMHYIYGVDFGNNLGTDLHYPIPRVL